MSGLSGGEVAAWCFVGGDTGDWQFRAMVYHRGEPLPPAAALSILPSGQPRPLKSIWTLRGVTSHLRYATRTEVDSLAAVQESLGRPQARLAASIMIRKSTDWWALAQDERREIFEAQSRHTEIGLRYLPAIARRLYHSRDLDEGFDFITWFEYAARDEAAFDQLVAELRAGPEWAYVDRECDLRWQRIEPSSSALR